MTTDDPTTRAASYALGGMTPAERREFEAEMARDRRLAAEVREFQETAAMLGQAVRPIEPSDDLRARLFASLDDAPQAAPVVQLRRAWYTRPVTALAAAAAVALLAVGGTVAVTQFIADDPATPIEQIQAAPDAERETVDAGAHGSVTLVWSLSLERAAVLVSDLVTAPEGSVYQLWVIDGEGHAAPSEVFEADGEQSVVLQGDMDDVRALGITVEPPGGSETPSQEPFVVIPMA